MENKFIFVSCIFVVIIFISCCESQNADPITSRREERKLEPQCVTYQGRPGFCRLLEKCGTSFTEIAQLSRSPCTISGNQKGVCCPPTKGASVDASSVVAERPDATPMPKVNMKSQNDAITAGLQFSKHKEQVEKHLMNLDLPVGTQGLKPQCVTYQGRPGFCRLLVKCTTFFAEIAQLSRSPCTMSGNQMGVCCPPTKRASVDPSSVVAERPDETPMPKVDMKSQNDAITAGSQFSKHKEQVEKDLVDRNIIAQPDEAVYWHAKLFQTTNDIVMKGKCGDCIVKASKILMQKFNLNQSEVDTGLKSLSVKDTVGGQMCPPEKECLDVRYRTIDGSCNNLRRGNWGKAGEAFKRKLPAQYSDGIDAFRIGVSGRPLTSSREVSINLAPSVSETYKNLTNLIWQWGQFLDHDITHTPISKGENMADITCCDRGHNRPPADLHPECRPISIPQTDNFFRKFNQSCMEFVRSMAAIPEGCTFGPRQQINQITSYIDGSNVYGSTEEEMRKLRAFRGGELKVKRERGRELLPGTKKDVGCRANVNFREKQCFLAGDSRVNEQVNLVVMHTVWLRQHNKIAQELVRLNRQWTDEIVFQEARRIVSAQMQHITYNEYLPIVLGRDWVEKHGLVPLQEGFFLGYDSNVDATMTNAFATAAFRYGHTLITDTLQQLDNFGIIRHEDKLSRNQFIPFSIYERETLDELIRGLTNQKSQTVDRFFSKELTNKLFAQERQFGMDLVALNIQRGRDHGIPSYTRWRETCGLPLVRHWNDLLALMTGEAIAHLASVYENVHDIDLFIGGVSEHVASGSLLGPTFTCIVGKQFISVKLGDRFYYENGVGGRPNAGALAPFSHNQLQEIRKTTLSRILCDNSDNIEVMQPLAFVTGHFANKRALCNSGILIPKMSLEAWRNSMIWA